MLPCDCAKGWVGLWGRQMTLTHRELELFDCCRSLVIIIFIIMLLIFIMPLMTTMMAPIMKLLLCPCKPSLEKLVSFVRLDLTTICTDAGGVLSFNLRRAENLGKMLED